jgi:serine/threonine protein kinase
MLRAGPSYPHSRSPSESRPPSSPIRRLVEPVRLQQDAIAGDSAGTPMGSHAGGSPVSPADFFSSPPAVPEASRIRREAFSPNYFSTFFTEERELGRGGKGVVLLVQHVIDGLPLGHFACKRVPVGDDHAWLEKVLVEVELLAKLSHPNLVSYRHVWLEDVKLNRFGPSVACAYILQQYCNGGDLLHYVVGDTPKEATKEELKAQIRRRSRGGSERPQNLMPTQRVMSLDEIYSLFKDITSGLAYLHEANYIHRDLKPSNCLLHKEGKTMVCLISDFGEVQRENAVRKSTGSTGTISYCAPEVLKRDVTGRFGNFTAKSDIFSLGMILYFMCFGRLPYQSADAVHEELEDIDLLRAEITDWKGFQDERRERPELPSKLYRLLKMMLSIDPVERPGAREVLGLMKGESGVDFGMARTTRSSSPPLGLGRHRIHSLDSPATPSTPVKGECIIVHPANVDNVDMELTSPCNADPTKHAHVSASEDDPSSTTPFESDASHSTPQTPRGRNSLQKHSIPDLGSPRVHSQAMTLTRSHDGFQHHRNSMSTTTATTTAKLPTVTSTVRSNSPTRTVDIIGPPLTGSGSPLAPSPHNQGTHTPGLATPLLMPPPTTRLGQLRHSILVTRYRCWQWTREHAVAVVFWTRLALFVTKMTALWGACWPFSFSPGVGASLVLVAALDLGLPPPVAATRTVVVTNVGAQHAGGVVAVRHDEPFRWRGSLGWGFRVSFLLLVLHFLVVWVAFRHEALCAVSTNSIVHPAW